MVLFECRLAELFLACPNWEEPLGQTQNMLDGLYTHLAWEFLGILQEPLKVTEEREGPI